VKRSIIILSLCSWLFAFGAWAQIVNSKSSNSKFIDDAYYWPELDSLQLPEEPMYDENAREFIFFEDTTQYPDTVRMRIIER
jgi:hypothetical protein